MNKILVENTKINAKSVMHFTAKEQAFMQNPLIRSNLRSASLFGVFFM